MSARRHSLTSYHILSGEEKAKCVILPGMDEGRKRVLAIVAGIIVARHLTTADDLFGGPQGSPRTDAMVNASIQWATKILEKIDARFGNKKDTENSNGNPTSSVRQ